MKRLLTIATICSTILLVGCETVPVSPEQLLAADYGAPMSAKQCTDTTEGLIRSTLKDPMSAQFLHTTPCYKGYMKQGYLKGGKINFGYLQIGQVNAKNSYGGYVGFRAYNAVIKNGAVVDYCIVEPQYGICE
jgi:hypothetical protein